MNLPVRPARWPQDIVPVRALLTRYGDFLQEHRVVICLAGYAEELETFPQVYDGEGAALLVAWSGEEAVGCVVVRSLPGRSGAMEMKRLYVAPAGRGSGAGRALINASIEWARARGARELLLDTVPQVMPAAVRLYRELGFEPTERYHDGEIEDLAFFRLPLA